jgi:type II secretory pathway pseudopilin PulG
MQRISRRFRRISARDEGGFTLLELVFSVSLLLVVLGAMMGIFQVVQRQSAYVKDRSETLDTMRIAVDRMTKEIRQARVVDPDPVAPAERFEMTTFLLGEEADIVYAVIGDTLTRSVNGGTAVVLQDDLAASNLFTYTADTADIVQVVSFSLQVHPPRAPETVLVLTSEVRLRNKAVTA